MVELAIALPILLVVLFMIIEFGFILYDKAVITNASREGARAGIVYRTNADGDYDGYDESDIRGVVNAYLDAGNILIPRALPTTTVPGGIICTGTFPPPSLIVRVAYTYTFFILPNLVTSITGPINLRGETIMLCDYDLP